MLRQEFCHNTRAEGIQTSNLVEEWSTWSTISGKHSKTEGQSSRSHGQTSAVHLRVP